MWGQARSRPRHPRRLGIIPTRVGTRGDMLSISPRWNNHPHACGDKSAIFRLSSSGVTIIPTRVGTRGQIVKNASTNWDHPHACGDKRVLNVLMTIAQGSSPRVWGQVLTYTSVYVYCRIIPTRVGTSF